MRSNAESVSNLRILCAQENGRFFTLVTGDLNGTLKFPGGVEDTRQWLRRLILLPH